MMPHRLLHARLLTSSGSACRSMRLFLVAFYTGLAVHFAPYVVQHDRFLGSDALPGNWRVFSPLPDWLDARVAIACAVLSCLAGLASFHPRVAAALTLVSLQTLLHRSSLPVQTLAVAHAWLVLAIVVVGGGPSDWTRPRSLVADQRCRTECHCSWTGTVIVYVTALAVLASALEKVAAGWIHLQPLANLLAFPRHHLLRSWLVDVPHSHAIGVVLQYATLAFELGLPLAVAVIRDTRAVALAWLAFFGGIVFALEVPILFLTTYGAISILLFRRAAPSSGRGDSLVGARALAVFIAFFEMSCSKNGAAPFAGDPCRSMSKITEVIPSDVTKLGVSADEIMRNVDSLERQETFRWTEDRFAAQFSSLSIDASAPSQGSTEATISIRRAGSPRWVDGGTQCPSALEIDVEYAIRTADGQLMESVPITITVLSPSLPAEGSVELAPDQVKGAFRASVRPGLDLRVRLSLTVLKGRVFGALTLLVAHPDPNGTSVSQILMGAWDRMPAVSDAGTTSN